MRFVIFFSLIFLVCWVTFAIAAVVAAKKTHLIVLSNGVMGNRYDLTFLAEQLQQLSYGSDEGCVVLQSTANEFLDTLEGVDAGGKKLADEVRTFQQSFSDLKSISFVGNSLGGLYARYAISELYDQQTESIAGLKARNFLTIATPHMGVRDYTYLDDNGLFAPDILKRVVAAGMRATGTHLFITDNTICNETLLYRMATEEQFLRPLRAFDRRRLLANLRRDFVVPLGTAAFLDAAEVNRLRGAYSNRYGIVEVLNSGSIDTVCSGRGDVEGCKDHMRHGLDSAGWEKVVVHFKGNIPLAHNQIAALTKYTPFIDRLLGFNAGQKIISDTARWLLEAIPSL